ncbi:MAG: efflux RND transporter permease subunit, partial [Nitrospirae bacterium]
TTWRGATPYEIERNIIEEQEKVLKGIPGLKEMESSSYNGSGSITLRFSIGTDVNNALLRVSNKLDEVPSYPLNVDKPVIEATGAATSPVIWLILRTEKDNPRSIYTYRTYLEDEIKQYLERVEGVADLFIGGGTEDEMHIVISPEKLASHALTISDVIRTLQKENENISAGTMPVGRRDYRIRTVSEFSSPEEIRKTVLISTGQRRVNLSDVSIYVDYGYEKLRDVMLYNGEEGIAIGIKPVPGTNVLALTDRVEATVKWLNKEKLRHRKIYLDWVYDQRHYIKEAINLVKNNVFIGGTLAVIVLLIFLRSILSTIVASVAIPISVIGTFIFMYIFGRNLNVVSLAGISFAVGMLVDNAIVVLENIDRHIKMGKSAIRASYDATKEVWIAVLASTLTTVAVFLPVVFLKEEAGQLFRDIAISVTTSVTLSLIVSISVIPMLSNKLYAMSEKREKRRREGIITLFGRKMVGAIMALFKLVTKNWITRTITIVTTIAISLLLSWLLMPKTEYLPQGNRNLVISILVPPPALSYKERLEIGEHIFRAVEPYFNKDKDGYPGINKLFYIGSENRMLFGATSIHEQRAGELVPLFNRIIHSIPAMFGVSMQAGIFETRLGRGRTIELNISGGDINRLVQISGMLFGSIMKKIPNSQIRPVPSLELLYPEVNIIPNRDRLRASSMSSEDLGIAVDVLMDGRKIGDYKEKGRKKIDMVLKASESDIETPEDLYRATIVTPNKKLVPLSTLSTFKRTTGITQIRHLERLRTITLEITPPIEMPLQ